MLVLNLRLFDLHFFRNFSPLHLSLGLHSHQVQLQFSTLLLPLFLVHRHIPRVLLPQIIAINCERLFDLVVYEISILFYSFWHLNAITLYFVFLLTLENNHFFPYIQDLLPKHLENTFDDYVHLVLKLG